MKKHQHFIANLQSEAEKSAPITGPKKKGTTPGLHWNGGPSGELPTPLERDLHDAGRSGGDLELAGSDAEPFALHSGCGYDPWDLGHGGIGHAGANRWWVVSCYFSFPGQEKIKDQSESACCKMSDGNLICFDLQARYKKQFQKLIAYMEGRYMAWDWIRYDQKMNKREAEVLVRQK